MRTAREMVRQLAQETGAGVTVKMYVRRKGRASRPENKADGHAVKEHPAVTIQRESVGAVTIRTIRKWRQGRSAAFDRIQEVRNA